MLITLVRPRPKNTMNFLVGVFINRILTNCEKNILVFDIKTDGPTENMPELSYYESILGYYVSGENGSDAWIESINNIDLLSDDIQKNRVREVIEVTTYQLITNNGLVDEDSIIDSYGYKLVFQNFTLTLEFRNEGPGYYYGHWDKFHVISFGNDVITYQKEELFPIVTEQLKPWRNKID